MTKTCKHCNGPIDAHGRSLSTKGRPPVYCSRECNDAARTERKRSELLAARPRRYCGACGVEIEPSGRKLTCSKECGIRYQNAKQRERRKAEWLASRPPCANCGGPIPDARKRGAKYCSDKCSATQAGIRWRARAPHYMRGYRYNLEPHEFEALVEAQGNRCAICHGEWDGKNKVPHVDHDHETGRVRGLLCESCNLGLGKFKDSAGLLRAAAAYLG